MDEFNLDSRVKQGRRISRREFLKASAVVSAAALANACAPLAKRSVPVTNEKVQLVYQDWRTEWFPQMAQAMLEKFHGDHPNIRVFYTPDPDNLEERMLVDMEAGTAPDVMAGCCDFFPIWAQKGYLLDLRPYVQADLDKETISDWNQAQYQAFFTADGRQFGLPKYHGALALYYNKDLFDKYKVEYPNGAWSYDDYLSAMKLLTKDLDGDGKIDQWGSMFDVSWERIQIHVNSFGGHFVDPQNPAHCLMGQPEALKACEWLRARIWDDQAMASFLDVKNVETRMAFIQQNIAMVEDGSWALKDMLADARFRIGVAPFPSGPVRHTTLATTDGFGIYAGTKHPDAAWELLKFLVSKDYARAMASAHFLQPARASLVNDWIQFIQQGYPDQTRDMDLAAFADGQIKGYAVVAEIFPKNMSDAHTLALSAWGKIFTLGQAQVDILKTVADQIDKTQK